MKGAIFYAGQYGSTAQYADWIAEATGLPVFNIHDSYADPTHFDFLVLGSSVIMGKLTIRKWVAQHLLALMERPVFLYSVSGAPAGPKVTGWIEASLPRALIARASPVALQGRMDMQNLPWWTRIILKLGALLARGKDANKEDFKGFDRMDKAAIAPIVNAVQALQSREDTKSSAA